MSYESHPASHHPSSPRDIHLPELEPANGMKYSLLQVPQPSSHSFAMPHHVSGSGVVPEGDADDNKSGMKFRLNLMHV